MKLFKFLALSAASVLVTGAYANDTISENHEDRSLRSRSAERDLLQLPELKLTKRIMTSKEIIEARYKKLKKAQRRQKIAAKKELIERNKKLNMIKQIPADVDTLNVAKWMEVLFMYPQAKNRKLENAIVSKTDALFKEGRRKYVQDADRKAQYLLELDAFFDQVEQNHKHWALDQYGYRQAVKPSRPTVQEVFQAPKLKTRQFAKKMKIWTKANAKVASAA